VSYPLSDIDGMNEEVARVFRKVGIRTTAKLLESAKDVKGRKALAAKTGFSERQLLRWANKADRMRVKGIGEEYAELLQAAGVDTVRELKHRNAQRLFKAMASANEKRRLVRLMPSERVVERWIEHAKKLPLKITY
jgi:predicted RecB family nuclease